MRKRVWFTDSGMTTWTGFAGQCIPLGHISANTLRNMFGRSRWQARAGCARRSRDLRPAGPSVRHSACNGPATQHQHPPPTPPPAAVPRGEYSVSLVAMSGSGDSGLDFRRRGRSATRVTAHLRIPPCVRTWEISAESPPRRSPRSFRVAENARLKGSLPRCSEQDAFHARAESRMSLILAWHASCIPHPGPFMLGRHASRLWEPGETSAC